MERRSDAAASGPPAFEPLKNRPYREKIGGNSLWHLQRLTGKALLTINPDQTLGNCDADGMQPVARAKLPLRAGKQNFNFFFVKIQLAADFSHPQTIGSLLETSDLQICQCEIAAVRRQLHASLNHRHSVQVHSGAQLLQAFSVADGLITVGLPEAF
jgi:hypothetical protein